MEKEERYLSNRFLELASKCYNKGIYTYSDFLNLYEQNIFNSCIQTLPPITFKLVGGNVFCERKIIVFEPEEAYYEPQIPISIIIINPLNSKFSDALNHRDFLGALMNLGIERNKLGDILVKDNAAYLFCIDSIAPYIVENLCRIKHTSVRCTISDDIENINIMPEFKEIIGTISNIRLDAVISLAFGTSRSSIVNFISDGKVFVNGKMTTSNGHPLKENDIVSVRGLGRCIYKEHISVTKKGRNLIKILKYI